MAGSAGANRVETVSSSPLRAEEKEDRVITYPESKKSLALTWGRSRRFLCFRGGKPKYNYFKFILKKSSSLLKGIISALSNKSKWTASLTTLKFFGSAALA